MRVKKWRLRQAYRRSQQNQRGHLLPIGPLSVLYPTPGVSNDDRFVEIQALHDRVKAARAIFHGKRIGQGLASTMSGGVNTNDRVAIFKVLGLRIPHGPVHHQTWPEDHGYTLTRTANTYLAKVSLYIRDSLIGQFFTGQHLSVPPRTSIWHTDLFD